MRIALPMPSDRALRAWGVTREQWADWTSRTSWEPCHTLAEALANPYLDYALSDAICEFGVPVPSEALHRANVMVRRTDAEALRETCALSGMPSTYLDAEADVARARRMHDEGRGLYVWGDVGRGKTHLACAIAKGWAELGRAFRFATAQQLLGDLRACYDGSMREADVLRDYSSVPLLVLDDLGKEVPTAWALSRLFQVVDARYNEGLPTVYTSQLSPRGMGERIAGEGSPELGDAIVSRIVGTCNTRHLEGPDRRVA